MSNENTNFGDGQFQIPEGNWAKFEKAIEKLSRKSIKLTGEPITPIVFGYDMVEQKNGTLIKMFNVLLGGDAPKLNGWSFIGRIDHANKEIGNIVRALPGKKVPEKYRDTGCICEHCNVNRYRRDTFVLQHEDGTIKQVGSTCLKDFLGHEHPEHLAKRAELLSYALELAHGYYNGVGCDRRYIDLETYLSYVSAEIRRKGYFVSKKTAQEHEMDSTSSLALNAMLNSDAHYHEKCTDADHELASAAIDWAQGLGEDGTELNDYQHNIKVLAASGAIEFRSVGYAASIVAAYQRATAPQAPRKVSQHVGSKGDKLNAEVTLKRVSVTPDRGFGEGWLYVFEDTEGNSLKWFTGKTLDLEEGDTCKLSFKVKDHEEYKGVKSTVVAYCKVEKPEAA